MLTKGAIGNLINRYRAVLKKCNLINTFGSLAVASMLVMGGAGVAGAVTKEGTIDNRYNIESSVTDGLYNGYYHISNDVTISNENSHLTYGSIDQADITLEAGKTLTLSNLATGYTEGAIGGASESAIKNKIEGQGNLVIESAKGGAGIAFANTFINVSNVSINAGGYGIYTTSSAGDTIIETTGKIEIISGRDAIHKSGSVAGLTKLDADGDITLTGRYAARQANAAADDMLIIDGKNVTLTGTSEATLAVTGNGTLSVLAEEKVEVNAGDAEAIKVTAGKLNVEAGANSSITGDIKAAGGTTTITLGKDSKIDGYTSVASGATLTLAGAQKGDLSILSQTSTTDNTGGAIENAGTLVVENATFDGSGIEFDQGNGYTHGGAIYTVGSSSTTVKGTAFNKNFATSTVSGEGEGGAIFVNENGKLTVEDSTFTENSATEFGGALWLGRNTESLITGSTFADNKADNAGAVYVRGGKVTLEGNTFENNSTYGGRGGALWAGYGAEIGFEGENTFTGNSAASHGGALTATQQVGGSTYTFNKDSVTEFTSNSAKEAGGAIHNEWTVSFEEGSSVTFTGNEAAYGGAIANRDKSSSKPVLNLNGTSTFSGNTAIGVLVEGGDADWVGKGGAIFNVAAGTVNIGGDAEFTGNTAATAGGAIYNEGTLNISGNATFANNTANGVANDIYSTGAVNVLGGVTSMEAIVMDGATLTVDKGTLNVSESASLAGVNVQNGGKMVTGDATAETIVVKGGHFEVAEDAKLAVTGKTSIYNNVNNGREINLGAFTAEGGLVLDGKLTSAGSNINNSTFDVTIEGGYLNVTGIGGRSSSAVFFMNDRNTQVTLDSLTIDNANANGTGLVMWNSDATLSIKDIDINTSAAGIHLNEAKADVKPQVTLNDVGKLSVHSDNNVAIRVSNNQQLEINAASTGANIEASSDGWYALIVDAANESLVINNAGGTNKFSTTADGYSAI